MYNELHDRVKKVFEQDEVEPLDVDPKFWEEVRKELIEAALDTYANLNAGYTDGLGFKWPDDKAEVLKLLKNGGASDYGPIDTSEWFMLTQGNTKMYCPGENTDSNEEGPYFGEGSPYEVDVTQDWIVPGDVKATAGKVWHDVSMTVVGP